MAATRAAAAANVPASSRNGTAAAAANSSPPSGGATSSLATIRAPRRRLLALASWSRGTTAGRIETAALSNRVSAVPRAKKTGYSSGRVATSASTATPSSPTARQRAASTRTISRRRSSRSTSAPLTSENSSQGRRWATASPATSRGSRVRVAASRGPATRVMPSPRLDTAFAVHNLAKSGPRPRVRRYAPCAGGTGHTLRRHQALKREDHRDDTSPHEASPAAAAGHRRPHRGRLRRGRPDVPTGAASPATTRPPGPATGPW